MDPDQYTPLIRSAIRQLFEQSPFAGLLDDPCTLLPVPGKMLRSRLLSRVGHANGIPEAVIVQAGAAIELIHTATLLHDDVIDNSLLRRREPTCWSRHGTSAAILLGDLFMFYAVKLLLPLDNPAINEALFRFAGEVGEAEVLQEMITRGSPRTWEECCDTARHKTGPFFAFPALMAAGRDEALQTDLTESGYLVGTAYQLADDLYDAHGNQARADKSLGRDSLRRKFTSAEYPAPAGGDPLAHIDVLLEESADRLTAYPQVRQAWMTYLNADIRPALAGLTTAHSQDEA